MKTSFEYIHGMKCVSITHRGGRANNEDAFYEGEDLFVVCDGVGGVVYGDVASKLACSSLADYFKEHTSTIYDSAFLNNALQYTIAKFQEMEVEHPEMTGMATTVVLIAFGENGAVVAWLGDSRLYHIRDGVVIFVTEDHSLANDLRKQGNTDEQHLKSIRNYITKSLSAKTATGFSFNVISAEAIQQGDYFFLCTDGVLENVTDELLCQALNTPDTREAKAQKILSLCEGKTKDNFTFQIITSDTDGSNTTII